MIEMCILRKTLVLLVFIAAITPASAANVSFLVIEAGLPNGQAASNQSNLWEEGLLDVFFESGHIVSNAPVLSIPHKPDAGFPGEADKDFADAINGGMEYFVIAIISHPAPHNVSLRLFRTSSQDMLFEQTYSDSRHVSARDEHSAIMNSIRDFATQVR